jgi:hypothetical protein
MLRGVILEGHHFDLADWLDEFQQPFDPWVETRHSQSQQALIILRSEIFDTDATDADVQQFAGPLVDQLNGAMALSRGTEPVRATGFVEIASDGSIDREIRWTVGISRGRSRALGAISAVGARDRALPPPTPRQSAAQRWNEATKPSDPGTAAQRVGDLKAELLVHLGRGDNWFDLYKAIDVVAELARGWHKLEKLMGAEGGALKDAKCTANYYRHGAKMLPDRLVSMSETRRLVHAAAKLVL